MCPQKLTITALLTLTMLIVNVTPMIEAQQHVTNGLLGFWTMDDHDVQGNIVRDISGNGNHGNAGGNPETTSGHIEQAFRFDGEDDFVALPDLGNEVAVSVDLWAHADQPFPDIRGLLSTFDPPQWKPGSIHFKLENNQIDILKNDGGRIQTPAEPNRWHHIAYTCDTSTDELTLYVDGHPIDTVAAGAVPNNLTSLRIGSEHEGRYFPGILDEVRLYGRALTEEEMRQNFEVSANDLAVHRTTRLVIVWALLRDNHADTD